ncbi:MAG TPA: AsmA family protein, partial [Candidatus Polarisedimenticolia bacterium]|nr:AsmA family protein [Candidatus Polarisedimenticolia bacterium]
MPDRARRARWRARIAWLALGAGALALLAILLLPAIIDVNDYRPLIASRAEAALGRPVTLGEMSLSVFPRFGIEVRDPAVEGLLSARSLVVGVRLLPLLSGRVELRSVVLRGPELTLTRTAAGEWRPGEEAPSAQQKRDAAPGVEPAGAGTGFSLARLGVQDGILRVRLERPSGGTLERELKLDLDASLEGTTGLETLSSRFEGEVTDGEIALEMSGSFDSAPGTLSLEAGVDRAEADVGGLRQLAQAAGIDWPLPEGLLGSGAVAAQGRVAAEMREGAPARIDLRGVTIRGLDVRLTRDAAGSWNVAALAGDAAAPPGGEAAAPGVDLAVDDLTLAEATVRLHDEAVPPGASPVDLLLSRVELAVDRMGRGRPLTLRARAGMEGGGEIEVSGTLPASLEGEAPVDARLSLEGVKLAPVAAYLSALLGVRPTSGEAGVSAELSGTWPARVQASGSLRLDDVALPGAPRPITAEAAFDLAALEKGARTEIASLTARSGDSRVELKGWIDNSQGATRLDVVIPPADVRARDLLDLLSVAGIGLPVELSSPGPVRVQAHVRGSLQPVRDLDLQGRLELSEATFRHPSMSAPMTGVQGTIVLQGDRFEVTGFAGTIGGSDVAGTLAVAGLDAPRVTFDLTSRRADFWELMSFMKQDTAVPPPAAAGAGEARREASLLDQLSGRGTLAIASGSFGTLDFADLTATLSLDGKVLKLEPTSMKLYGGTVSGSASMDLRAEPARYTVSADLAGLDADALLSDNLGLQGTLTGALSGRLTVSSHGGSRQEALRNAGGGGAVRVDNGRVGPLNVLKVVSRASDVLGERSLEQVAGRLAKEGTEFSRLSATLRVDNGSIATDDLLLVSPDLELRDDGSLDMMAGGIDLAAEIVFSEEISRTMVEEGSRAAEYFWDARRQRVNLPLTLTGPIEAPRPSIDWETAGGNLARRKVEEKVGEKLGGRLRDLLRGEG